MSGSDAKCSDVTNPFLAHAQTRCVTLIEIAFSRPTGSLALDGAVFDENVAPPSLATAASAHSAL